MDIQKKFYLCETANLVFSKYINKWIEELKDEVIIFLGNNKEIKIFSSICPHFGGEIIYDYKMQVLKCKWHDWRFCSESAACLTFPKISKLKKYTYTIENKKIYLTIE